MPGDDVSHVVFVGVGDFDLIVLAAVSDAVGEGVRLITGAVLLLAFFYCRVCGGYMGWLGVTLDENFQAASVAATSNSEAGIMLSSTYPSANSPTSAT